jgi:hypothetical protein
VSLSYEEDQRFSINTREFLQFHYIYPALAGFTLGNERLGSPQLSRDRNLGEPSPNSSLPQFQQKVAVAVSVCDVFQSDWIIASLRQVSQLGIYCFPEFDSESTQNWRPQGNWDRGCSEDHSVLVLLQFFPTSDPFADKSGLICAQASKDCSLVCCVRGS